MKNPTFFLFKFLFISICSGCCSVATIENPMFGPVITASIVEGSWDFSIIIQRGGIPGTKYINPHHIRGDLWLVYTLQIFEAGIPIFESNEIIRYENNLEKFNTGDAIHKNLRYPPVLASSGVAVLKWRIIIASENPGWSDSYSQEQAVDVISGTEVAGVSPAVR